jgi:hypothetical protein
VAGYSVTYSVVDNATKQIDQITRRIQQMRAPTERMGKSLQRFVDVSGLRKVAGAFTWIGQAAAGAFRSIIAIVPALGALTSAATIAGMARLVGHFAEWGKTLQINARQIGINADELQKWEDATSRAGGSAEDMAESLKALHQASANALLKGGDTLAYFNRLHISLRDSNGQLRSATDLMPEVFKGLDSLADPADRARVAAALLGDEQNKVYEAYRLSGKSLEDWLRDEEHHQRLTDEQIKSLNQYRLAMADVGTTFDQLGRQIGAVLAKNLTPFIQHLNDFVQKHQPEIIAAIDNISARFGAWLNDPTTWANFEKVATKIANAVVLIANNLDTVITASEVLLGLWVGAKVLAMLASIAQIATAFGKIPAAIKGVEGALGAPGAGGAMGTGLLGKIGLMGFLMSDVYSTWSKLHREGIDPSTVAPGSPLQTPEQEKREQPKSLFEQWTGSSVGGALGALGRRLWNGPEAIQRQSMNLPESTVQRGAAIRDKLATDLNLSPAQASGIVGNLQAESGLKAVQERNPIGGGRGGFGWAQWTGSRRREFEAYAKEHNLDPKSDEANYGFLLKELQSPEYAAMLAKLRAQQGTQAAQTSAAIVEHDFERPAVSNAGTRMNMAAQIAAGPSAAPPPPAGTINGAVDVSITHRNPPPDATVSAKGSGSVNVAPLRTERPQVSFADA